MKAPIGTAQLTPRQSDILFFIREFIAEHCFPPSIREIGEAMGTSSSSTVFLHLRKLREKGYIGRQHGRFRSIVILADAGTRADVRSLSLVVLSEWVAKFGGLSPDLDERTAAFMKFLRGEP